jgi:(p)ppGpp synthase/HD superfamily hydrolase
MQICTKVRIICIKTAYRKHRVSPLHAMREKGKSSRDKKETKNCQSVKWNVFRSQPHAWKSQQFSRESSDAKIVQREATKLKGTPQIKRIELKDGGERFS